MTKLFFFVSINAVLIVIMFPLEEDKKRKSQLKTNLREKKMINLK